MVDDQHGNPTYAPHLAQAILAIIEKLGGERFPTSPWGVYHAAGTGETTWFGFAQEVFRCHQALGHGIPSVRPMTPPNTPVRYPRPANSRLNTDKLAQIFGVRLPPWQNGVAECVWRLSEDENVRMGDDLDERILT